MCFGASKGSEGARSVQQALRWVRVQYRLVKEDQFLCVLGDCYWSGDKGDPQKPLHSAFRVQENSWTKFSYSLTQLCQTGTETAERSFSLLLSIFLSIIFYYICLFYYFFIIFSSLVLFYFLFYSFVQENHHSIMFHFILCFILCTQKRTTETIFPIFRRSLGRQNTKTTEHPFFLSVIFYDSVDLLFCYSTSLLLLCYSIFF